MDARFAMWVHGISFFPERTAGDAGGDGPLVQVREWVDGPGVPFSDITGLHQGSGVTFRGKRNHDNWFHVAIPTPVIVPVYQPASQHYNAGQRIRLEKVFVLFKNYVSARGGALARIREVHVWDGAQTRYDTIVVPPADPNLSGDHIPIPIDGDLPPDPEPLSRDPYQGNHHMQIQPGWNTWTLTSGGQPIKPVLMWGVGISVLVHFADEIDIMFAAAGADFLLDVP